MILPGSLRIRSVIASSRTAWSTMRPARSSIDSDGRCAAFEAEVGVQHQASGTIHLSVKG